MIGSTIVSSHEDGLDKLGRHARVVLVLLAAVQLAGLGFLYSAGSPLDRTDMFASLGVGAIFVVLALWARKQPLPAVVIGLVFYLASVGVVALADPRTLFQGLMFKAIVLVMF